MRRILSSMLVALSVTVVAPTTTEAARIGIDLDRDGVRVVDRDRGWHRDRGYHRSHWNRDRDRDDYRLIRTSRRVIRESDGDRVMITRRVYQDEDGDRF